MSHLSKNHFLITSKCFIFMQTPLLLDIWLQSYKEFINATNNIKQRNLNTVFANISKPTWPTSDSFHLIMSHNIRHFFQDSLLEIVFSHFMLAVKSIYGKLFYSNSLVPPGQLAVKQLAIWKVCHGILYWNIFFIFIGSDKEAFKNILVMILYPTICQVLSSGPQRTHKNICDICMWYAVLEFSPIAS